MGDAVDQQERIPVRQDLQYILIVEPKIIATVWRIRHVTHEGLVKVTIIRLAAQTETGVRVRVRQDSAARSRRRSELGFSPTLPANCLSVPPLVEALLTHESCLC